MSGPLVLVVDDEPQILRALEPSLRDAGFAVVTAANLAEAHLQAVSRRPDAIVLDLVLPDGSGTDFCRELRTWFDAPVLVLSAVGEERQKIAALDAGADDYITKPFSVDELIARLRAALRRASPTAEPIVSVGNITIDLERRLVRRSGEVVSLTPHEFSFLALLARNRGKLLTHGAILRAVWGPAYQSESHYLHVYASQLRRKLEEDPRRPRYLVTEPGAGYRLIDPEEV